ncbi:MAG: hypothetical protein P8X96_08660 [Desulfobacteraceae bacterium]|jgi:DNA-binding NtrC family response regulator
MKSTVAILDNDPRQTAALCELLQSHGWKSKTFVRYEDLAKDALSSDFRIIILNLDNINVDAVRIGKIGLINNKSYIIALSSQFYHPGLKEAFRKHISVCIANPVDLDELLYWLTTFEP